ncbi:MAG: class I adenylate-forming enzyme family protein, partial [Pseudomonadota bacterium]
MPSALDLRMDKGIAGLTGAGGPMALTDVTVRGRSYPMIAATPPSLPHYFAHYCAAHADTIFLVSGDERLTFSQVYEQAGRVARALVAGGTRRGDRIGIAMRNSPSWITLYMGISMAGGIAVLLNGWWQPEEFAGALSEVECAIVFADGARAKRLADVAGLTARIVTIEDIRPLAEALSPIASDAAADLPDLGPDDLATILFTSGSTGSAKGALSDHRAVLSGTLNFLASALVMLGLSTEDGKPPQGQPSTLLNVPLFHVTAEVPVLLQSFAMGRKLVLMPKWDAEDAMRLIEAEKVSYFVGVPLMSFEILTHPNRGHYDLSSVTDFAAGGGLAVSATLRT